MTSDQSDFVERFASSPTDFIGQRAVFRTDELEAWYVEAGRGDVTQARKIIAYHVQQGRLRTIRRGLYAHMDCVDQWLIASRLTTDAVIAFDGALSLRSLIGDENRVCYVTRERMSAFCFNETIFQPVKDARISQARPVRVQRGGLWVRTTSLEQAFVDCLERLDLAPELPLLVQALARASEVKLSELIRVAARRESRLLMARVAWLLGAAGRRLGFSEQYELSTRGLVRPDYFRRSERGPGDSIIARLNLIVSPEQRRLYDAADGAGTLRKHTQLPENW
jgi:predicted transcriptional regulator of viral defense system